MRPGKRRAMIRRRSDEGSSGEGSGETVVMEGALDIRLVSQ